MDNITEEELNRLRNSKNEEDWNDACDAIKAARGGRYPSDWWPKVMQSGLSAQVAKNWGQPDAFEIKAFSLDTGKRIG
jgi:hypothetical protein